MVNQRRVYSFSELEEVDRASAPSLDLPSVRVEKFFMPRDGGKYMVLLVNATKALYPTECPYCRKHDCLIKSGRAEPRLVHDVTRNNYRVDLVIQPPRLYCRECDQRFSATIQGIEDHRQMTTRLLEYIRQECFLQSQTNLAALCGVSIETISNILDEEIDKFNKDREENPIAAPKVLGIDEKHIDNVMRGTLVDVQSGQLLDMMHNNKKDSFVEAIKKLAGWDTNIKVVTTDMSNAYISWLPDLLPNATIVIDKFHVIQDIEKRVSKTKSELYAYRKALIYQVQDNNERTRQLQILNYLNDTVRLMNYSMESVVRDDKDELAQKLATLIEEFPEFRLLRKLYYLVEFMYTKETREEAEAVWDQWMETLPPIGEKQYKEWCDLYSLVPPLFEAFKSFKRSGFMTYKPYILNYFNPGCNFTNAATEGLNNLIGSINSVGNGYSFRVLRAKSLYASLLYERITYSLSMKTVETWTPTFNMTLGYGGKTGIRGTMTKYGFTKKRIKLDGQSATALASDAEFVDSFKRPEPALNEAAQLDYCRKCEDSITFNALRFMPKDEE